jgi:hypothetical protein
MGRGDRRQVTNQLLRGVMRHQFATSTTLVQTPTLLAEDQRFVPRIILQTPEPPARGGVGCIRQRNPSLRVCRQPALERFQRLVLITALAMPLDLAIREFLIGVHV